MTKSELSKAIYERCPQAFCSQQSAVTATNEFFDIIKEELRDGKRVNITGFGTFFVTRMNSRKGRNLHTGELIEIPARPLVRFRVSQLMRNMFTK